MGLPIVGQVSRPFSQPRIWQTDFFQHYNLVSLAFYLGGFVPALLGFTVK